MTDRNRRQAPRLVTGHHSASSFAADRASDESERALASLLAGVQEARDKAGSRRRRAALPLLPCLVLIFAAAKVFGFSTMSWLWVFSPILIPLGAVLGIWLIVLAGLGIFYGVLALVNAAKGNGVVQKAGHGATQTVVGGNHW